MLVNINIKIIIYNIINIFKKLNLEYNIITEDDFESYNTTLPVSKWTNANGQESTQVFPATVETEMFGEQKAAFFQTTGMIANTEPF